MGDEEGGISMQSITRSYEFYSSMAFFLTYSTGFNKVDDRPVEEIVREKLLTVLESAYPNVLSVEDLIK